MSVNSGAYLKQVFQTVAALGDKEVSSDFTMEIEGFEEVMPLIKQFPVPELSVGGEIGAPMPLGSEHWQPQQAKINQQGQITFMETKAGHVRDLTERLLTQNGGRFNARIYAGTPDNYTKVFNIYSAFIQLDNADADMENRSQIQLVSGTIFFHYFGSES